MLDQNLDKLIELSIAFAPKIILAIVTLFIGLKLVNVLTKVVSKVFRKKQVEESLSSFLLSVLGLGLKAMLLISVVSMVGVEMTSFIALLGGAGVAIGMALSGTLQNFAGGVIILIIKPFKVGDFIEAQGYTGIVSEIQIFNTVLKTPDNKTIIIPNSPLSTGSLINYTAEKTRRVDFVFGIGYNDDIDKARSVISSLIAKDSKIHKEPAEVIVVGELADNSVNLTVRVWTNSEEYWNVFFNLTEAVKKEFDKEGISIPYPQRDVHIHEAK